MGQITIYLDDETEQLVRRHVKKPGESTSKWIAEAVSKRVSDEWPPDVLALFGSCSVLAVAFFRGNVVAFIITKAPVKNINVDVLRNPTFPATEWDRVRGQTLAALAETSHARTSRCPDGDGTLSR